MAPGYRLPLDRERFRDALRKGLGRAHLHVRAHGTDAVADDLLEACRRSWAYARRPVHGRALA